MMASCFALTALTDRIGRDELACVAAALQTQVARDFASTWAVSAIIAAVSFEAIPAGYCPVIVLDGLDIEGAPGPHVTRSTDSPYILVPYGPSWSLTASHMVLQMLVNPTGSARRPGPSGLPGQGTVEYLADICAPCQDIGSAYAIDGIVVSDFCLPVFFGGAAVQGGGHSFTGAVREAFRPAANGQVTWFADDGLLYQTRADTAGRLSLHGGFSSANRGRMTMHELIDALTPERLHRLSNARFTPALLEAQQNARRVRLANLTRYQEDIAWRFGPATRSAQAPRPEPMPRVQVARYAGYTGGVLRSGQNLASDDVRTTARTDS
jgi:hypothetical protein